LTLQEGANGGLISEGFAESASKLPTRKVRNGSKMNALNIDCNHATGLCEINEGFTGANLIIDQHH
jgi:hypothetical protein